MQIEQHTIDPLNAELTIHVAPSDYSDRFEKKLKEFRKTIQLPGFRPGQVPVSLIRKRYGRSVLAEEMNALLQDAIHRFIDEKKIQVLGSPIPQDSDSDAGNWDEPGEFRFRYQMGLAPEMDFKLDKKMKFTMYKVRVDENLINRQAKDLARRYGALSEPEVSGDEDLIVADLAELLPDGQVKEGGIQSRSTISIEFIKDQATKSQLIGLKKGDSIHVDPTKLSDNHEDLARMLGITHHDVHHLHSLFQLRVEELKHVEPHAYDQELFDKIYGEGEVQSEEVMRERIKDDLGKMFLADSEWLFKREASAELISQINPQLPDDFLKKLIAVSSEKPLSGEMIQYEYPLYARSIRWDLMVQKILQDFAIQVSYDEILEHVKSNLAAQFAQYRIPIEGEQLTEMARKQLQEKDTARNIHELLRENKIMEVIQANCTIDSVELPHDEFVNRVQHVH